MYLVFFLSVIVLFYLLKFKKDFFKSVKKNKLRINRETKKIVKPYHNKRAYFRIKKLYKKTLHKFDFVPRMDFNDKKFEITEDYIPSKLKKKNRPKDYVKQLENIYKTFRDNNLYHNELREPHLLLKNGKIFVIDFEWTSSKYKKWGFNKPLEYHINRLK